MKDIRNIIDESLKSTRAIKKVETNNKFAIKYPMFSQEEIKENSKKLITMQSIKDLTGNEFENDGTPLDERVIKFFESLNNNVYSELFGDVALSKSSVRSERRHGNTSEKIIAYAAVPETIKNGVVIDIFEKHYGVERIVVAAPITISNEKYYLGVMLQRDNKSQRLYAHDVVIEKETSSLRSDNLNTTGSSQNKGSLYITDILLNALSVNTKHSINELDNEYMSDVESGNVAEQQRLVNEAAERAGYVGTYYHGTKGNFTEFSKIEGGKSNSNASVGFWFTESEEGAQKWANESWYGDSKEGKVYKVFLSLNNPKVYESVDSKAQIEELYQGYETIDKELSLYDAIYWFEDGRRYHSERYDYDKSKRRRSGIDEWDVFKAIVKKFDSDTIEYYLSQVSEEQRETVKKDAERYLELVKDRKALEKQITELSYSDSYEQFRTDVYKQVGMNAEDANIGGTGKYVENKEKMLEGYVNSLKEEGYDGIEIMNTSYDSMFFGGTNNQYVVFDSNQIKSADPITYDDNDEVIPLSERFNLQSNDIRYSVNEDFSITKKEMEENIVRVSEMSSVAELSGDEFKKGEIDLVTQVTNYFNSIGGEVENKNLGTVYITHAGVKSSLGHGIGRVKSIAFKAVPQVIKNGKIIDYQKNWKNK